MKPRLHRYGNTTAMLLVTFLLAVTAWHWGGQDSRAQDPIDPLQAVWWGDLLTIPSVDSAQVEWLERNANWQSAMTVFELVDKLSNPSAFQLLPSYYLSDASYYYLMAEPQTFKELQKLVGGAMSERPPINEAAYVHAAYCVLRSRQIVEDFYQSRPEYQMMFRGQSFPAEELNSGDQTPIENINIGLRFDYARNQLNYLTTSGGNLEGSEQLMRTPVMHALVNHRQQSFYPIGASHEMLVDLLSRAASDAELSQLYALANPFGNFHYTEIRNYADEYLQVLVTLSQHRPAIESHLEITLSPYIIQGASVNRVIDFTFGDGADGWGSEQISAIDLEYFKDDYLRLLATLTHESVHAIHSQFQKESNALDITHELQRAKANPLMLEFARSLIAVYREGIATHIQPPEQLTEAEQINRASIGASQLDSLAAIYFEASQGGALLGPESADRLRDMRTIRNRGTRGAGPYYWLGKEIAQSIEEGGGKVALAQLLREDAMVFFDAYRQAVSDHQGVITSRAWQLMVDTNNKIGGTR
ncbi:MAG: DUF5700 domain-containing putative Zn-dependent protease [Bacteroidota bacterium]